MKRSHTTRLNALTYIAVSNQHRQQIRTGTMNCAHDIFGNEAFHTSYCHESRTFYEILNRFCVDG